ncbi:MAG: hypothetical protein WDA65_09695 [Christensenellales bacterium]
MQSIFQIIFVSYLAGVNIYGFTLLRIQKREALERMAREQLENARQQCRKKGDAESGESKNGGGQDESGEEDIREESREELRAEDECVENAEKALNIGRDVMTEDKSRKRVRDAHILIAALLGGAASIYLGMFFMKYKLKNILFMLLIPTFIGAHAALIYKFLWGMVFVTPAV